MSTNTPTGENGKKELKVTEVDNKLIYDYFNKWINNYEKYPNLTESAIDYEFVLSSHSLIFKTKDENIKSQLGDDTEKKQSFVQGINVLENGKRDFILEEIANEAGFKIKLADIRKVKEEANKIKKNRIELKISKSNDEHTK